MALAPAVALFFLLQTDHAAEGRKALDANNYTLAFEHFSKAVEEDPRDWASRFHLALSLSLLNKDPEAAAAYRRVLEDQPGLYEAELNLGVVLLRQKAAPEAATLLESAAAKKPKEYRPVFYLAQARALLEDLEGAEAGYRRAIGLDPKSAEAAVGLARVLVKQKRLADADPLYRRAAESDPEFKRALLELASHYEQAREPIKAIALYREFPGDPVARERLGELLLESGQPANAIVELEKAFAQSPTPANRLALATAYLRAGKPGQALPLLEQVVAAAPEDLDLRLYYGRALRDQRNFQSAAKEFWKATQIRPDSKDAWSELAGMLILLENYPQALSALDRARALGGDPGAHAWFSGMIFDHLKDYKQALAAYERFLSLSQGKNPDEEFKARQRIKVIQKELSKR
ncbi:MAG: tetratricopeptide repeat protein [Acidobacteria bacterium]|nr:tetratricopeptide repeat protein [Acidobacteriota bacterium]